MSKDKPDEKNIHAGHRARLFDTYDRADLRDLSPHQVLEYILFYILPRGDTNGLAHRLLNKFKTIENIFEADEFSLCQVDGINKTSAKKIKGLLHIFEYYQFSKIAQNQKISNWASIYDLCETLVRFQGVETLYAIALDPSLRVINARRLGQGNMTNVAANPKDLLNFINETHAAAVIITHNHPGGKCRPSKEDEQANALFKNITEVVGAKYIDSVIVGYDGVYSIENMAKARSYIEEERELSEEEVLAEIEKMRNKKS